MERQRQISEWIGRLNPGRDFTLAPASADASFRRYLRVTFDDGTTRVVMDAPPSHEDVKPWLHVQKLFHDAGVHVPEVYATDLDKAIQLAERSAREVSRVLAEPQPHCLILGFGDSSVDLDVRFWINEY